MDSPLGGLSEPDIAAVLAQIREYGGEVFVEHRDSLTLRLESGSLETRSDRDIGAGVRFGTGGPRGFASTNVLTAQGLIDAARVAAGSVGQPLNTAAPRGQSLPAIRSAQAVQLPRVHVDAVDVAEKAAAVRRTSEAAWAIDARVRQVSVTYVDVVQHVLVIGREGEPMQDVRTRARVTCRVVARDGDVQGSGFDGPGIGGGIKLTARREFATTGATIAVLVLVTGLPSQVVLGPSAGGMHDGVDHRVCAVFFGHRPMR